MLAKKYRLPIQKVIGKKGKAVRTPYFLIKIFPNLLPYGRIGIIISKKVDNKSTKRNALKRKIFSIFNPESLNKEKGKDFLIIVSPRIKELRKEEIMLKLKEALMIYELRIKYEFTKF